MLKSLLKRLKFGMLLPPFLKNNGAFAVNNYWDTKGLSGLMVLFITGITDAALGSTSSATPPLLEQCDTTDGSYTAITGAALATVIGSTDDNTMRAIAVNLTKTHKRYVRVQAPTAANGTTGDNLCILGIGFPSDQFPGNAADMGLAELIEA